MGNRGSNTAAGRRSSETQGSTSEPQSGSLSARRASEGDAPAEEEGTEEEMSYFQMAKVGYEVFTVVTEYVPT